MTISNFVKISSWSSILAILWLRMLGIIPNDFSVWFGFAFFCMIGLSAYSVGRRG